MEKDYKDTLNLPRTDFPMKANLTKMEEVMLEKWKTTNIYQKLRETGKDKKNISSTMVRHMLMVTSTLVMP